MNLLNQITGKSALIARNQRLESNFQLFKRDFENLKCESQALRDTNRDLIKSNDQLDKSHKDLIEESNKLREEVRTLLYEITLLKDEQKESHKEVMDGIHEIGKGIEKPLEVIDCRGMTSKESKPSEAEIIDAKNIDAMLKNSIPTKDELKQFKEWLEDPNEPQEDTNVKQEEKPPNQKYKEGFKGKIFDGANHIFLVEDKDQPFERVQPTLLTPQIPESDHEDGFKSPETEEIPELTKKEEKTITDLDNTFRIIDEPEKNTHLFNRYSPISEDEAKDELKIVESWKITKPIEKEEVIEKVTVQDELQSPNSQQVIPTIPQTSVKPSIESITPDKVHLSPAQKKIVNYVSKHPRLTMTKIKEGVNIAATGNYLKILVGKGVIKKNEDKTYSVS